MDCVPFHILTKIIRYGGDFAKLFVTNSEGKRRRKKVFVATREGRNRCSIGTSSEKRNVNKNHKLYGFYFSPRMNTEENKSGVYFLGGLDIEIVYALKVRHSLRCYKKTLLWPRPEVLTALGRSISAQNDSRGGNPADVAMMQERWYVLWSPPLPVPRCPCSLFAHAVPTPPARALPLCYFTSRTGD